MIQIHALAEFWYLTLAPVNKKRLKVGTFPKNRGVRKSETTKLIMTNFLVKYLRIIIKIYKIITRHIEK